MKIGEVPRIPKGSRHSFHSSWKIMKKNLKKSYLSHFLQTFLHIYFPFLSPQNIPLKPKILAHTFLHFHPPKPISESSIFFIEQCSYYPRYLFFSFLCYKHSLYLYIFLLLWILRARVEGERGARGGLNPLDFLKILPPSSILGKRKIEYKFQ